MCSEKPVSNKRVAFTQQNTSRHKLDIRENEPHQQGHRRMHTSHLKETKSFLKFLDLLHIIIWFLARAPKENP